MKQVRTLILTILVISFSAVCLSYSADYKYVGSAKSNKYHYPTCEWAKNIAPKSLITFESAKKALDAGYVPCKVCKPPTND